MTYFFKLLLCLLVIFALPACSEDNTTPDPSYTPVGPDNDDDNTNDDGNGDDNNGDNNNDNNDDNNDDGSNDDDNNDDNNDSSLEHQTIEIPNGDFEEHVDFSGSQGAWKKGNAWYTSRATFTYQETGGVNNSACIKISCSNETTDAPAVQTITGLTIGVPYELSAQIKTEGINKGRGGSVGIFEWSGFIASGSYTGNQGWSKRKVLFIPETESVEICCRLGFWGGDSQGTAWFDDVKMETPENIYTRQGEHVVLYFYDHVVTISNSAMDEWLGDLDKAYEAYCELFDFFKPFDGKKMPILSNEVDAWAIAGYPIQWHPNYIKSTLEDMVKHDDTVFGILHEMGHNFGPDNYTSGAHDHGNGNWNWNEELFANFRMYYALQKHDFRIYTDGKVFVGTEIDNKYSKDAANCWANNKDLDGAGMMWPLCQMVADVGWEPFKKAFKELYNLDPSQSFGSTKWEKINYFLSVVSKHADKDMLEFLTDEQIEMLKKWK